MKTIIYSRITVFTILVFTCIACNEPRVTDDLGEISEILRHQSICTTQIYAKVELEALRKIAQSWPGGEK